MSIGGADHSVLVRIHAKLLLELQAIAQGWTGIFVLQHFGLLFDAKVEIALVPALVICELVVGRKEG